MTKPGHVIRATSRSTTEVMGQTISDTYDAMEWVAEKLVTVTEAQVPACGGMALSHNLFTCLPTATSWYLSSPDLIMRKSPKHPNSPASA
ncbi:hypothetical protein P7K49_005215 [Saguinus oedipus]|uniref:Uncharacterized protein n=1 Tax=Saguinus oedipus TaxID=9490 RepID=A0ABQ9WC28_SAGOE|nr:hypothetical protein P7K49_005215 [Saguinus oedipus]